MNKVQAEALDNELQAEVWALTMAAQTPDREPREAQWLLHMADHLDSIAEKIQAAVGGPEL